MDIAKAQLSTRSGPLGANPKERVLGYEVGPAGRLPSGELLETLTEVSRAASELTAKGHVTEVRILFIPDGLPATVAGKGNPAGLEI